tara:strand:+ start:1529 stop:2356 length:828 start_codon:yes stop_codon:yes gene_type:complete
MTNQNHTDALNSVKAKIRALAAKTVDRGCTENEANVAMQKVGDLLDQYNLNMTEVLLADEEIIQQRVTDGAGKNTSPIKHCTVAIARFCDVQVWMARAKAKWVELSNGKLEKQITEPAGYVFMGFEPDVMMAVHLYEIIQSAMQTELERFKQTDTYMEANNYVGGRRRASTSFLRGMALTVYNRLDDMKDDMNEAEARRNAAELQETGRALVVAKNKLIDQARKDAGIRLVTRHTYERQSNYSAKTAGGAAGQRVNLNRPVGGGSTGGQRMIGHG